MITVVFRIIGCRQVFSATNAPEMTQHIMSVANGMRSAPASVSIQIAMPRSGGGVDWGDLCLIPSLGKWRYIEIKSLFRVRNALWAAMLHANEKWEQQQRISEAFSKAVAAPGPLRLAGEPSGQQSFEWRDS